MIGTACLVALSWTGCGFILGLLVGQVARKP